MLLLNNLTRGSLSVLTAGMEKQLNIHPYPLLKIPPKIADQCRTAVCAVYQHEDGWCRGTARVCELARRGGHTHLARESRITGVADAFVVGKVAPVSGLLRSSACAARDERGFDGAWGAARKPAGFI